MEPQGRPQPIPRDARQISVPAVVLDAWLAAIDDPVELKTTLRVVAILSGRPTTRGAPPSLSLDELLDDTALNRADGITNDDSIRAAVAAGLFRGSLLAIRSAGDVRVMLNDERNHEHLTRNGLTLLAPTDVAGVALPESVGKEPVPPEATQQPRGNVFALYEKHIGTFGHGMAEQLRAAEEEYPASWIADAFAIATEQNVRRWGYVHAILRRWLQQGKPAIPAGAGRQTRETNHDDGEPGHDTAPDSRSGYLESYRRRYGRLPWEPVGDPDGDRE